MACCKQPCVLSEDKVSTCVLGIQNRSEKSSLSTPFETLADDIDNASGITTAYLLGIDLLADNAPEHDVERFGTTASHKRSTLARLDFLSNDAVKLRVARLGELG